MGNAGDGAFSDPADCRWSSNRMIRKSLLPLSALCAALLSVACAGPRMKSLTDKPLPARHPGERVDVYVGKLEPPFEPVAIVDSDAYPYVTDEVKERQIEQLQARARGLGANTLHEVRILTKQVKGFTPDEKVPFASWKQGSYDLYFMRATAILRRPSEPSTLDEARPDEGWAVDRLSAPPTLQQAMAPPPAMPRLRADAATSSTARVLFGVPGAR
jgi:hypothetical protein